MRLFWPLAIKQSHTNILEYMPVCVVRSVRNIREMKVLDSEVTHNPRQPRITKNESCQFDRPPAQETVSQPGVITLSDLCLLGEELSLL